MALAAANIRIAATLRGASACLLPPLPHDHHPCHHHGPKQTTANRSQLSTIPFILYYYYHYYYYHYYYYHYYYYYYYYYYVLCGGDQVTETIL